MNNNINEFWGALEKKNHGFLYKKLHVFIKEEFQPLKKLKFRLLGRNTDFPLYKQLRIFHTTQNTKIIPWKSAREIRFLGTLKNTPQKIQKCP